MSESEVRRRGRGGSKLLVLIVLLWLVIGVAAAYQRDYFKGADRTCAKTGTIAVTVVTGPLNYVGANPKVTNCNLPQPSK